MIVVMAGTRVELAKDDVRALADHLWKGLCPGAVTAAGKLDAALGRTGAVELEAYEVDAVRASLAVLGLS